MRDGEESSAELFTEKQLIGLRTLVVEEASGPLLIVGRNDGSNEEVCDGDQKNDQKDHLSLPWQHGRRLSRFMYQPHS